MALETVLSAPARSREVVNRVTKSSDSRVSSTELLASSSKVPVPFQRGERNTESLGRFSFAQSAEKAQFNYFGSPAIEGLKPLPSAKRNRCGM